MGIVRGKTQRLIKLELNRQPSDDLIIDLDKILLELKTGRGDNGLKRIKSVEYNDNLNQLTIMWEDLKNYIQEVRGGAESAELLALSETYYILANETVFAAEDYSNRQTSQLTIVIVFMITVTLVVWLILMWVFSRRNLYLEGINQSLAERVYKDALTGASSEEKFKLDAKKILKENFTSKYAISYVDFENFKYINDVFGYAYGDRILKQYVKILYNDMGAHETFCRVSADNFVILRCYLDKQSLLQQQKNVDNKIAEYAMASKEKYYISLYCGICCIEDVVEELTINGLIERANFARKAVKNQPVAHYAFYDESIRNKMRAEKAIENRMIAAMDNKEFVVYLQPKVSLKTGMIACSEALVRWMSPSKGMISPGEFIPIFERNLFIVRLDQYVMEEVCKWLRQQIDEGNPALPVSVNVSRMQLYDPEFVSTYASIKDRYQIQAGMLEIEFTESVVFENLSLLLKIVDDLKREGFYCSLDDFGNGYSSLNLLKNLPVDVLKLDSLFFDESKSRNKARTVITGIVSMVKELDMVIVAEGVEKEEQVTFLRDIGCDLIQGFVFYRPMPMKDFEQLLKYHS